MMIIDFGVTYLGTVNLLRGIHLRLDLFAVLLMTMSLSSDVVVNPRH